MGRWSYSNRSIIEHSAAVPMQTIHAAGILKNDCDATWAYPVSRGEEIIADVAIRISSRGDNSFIQFDYDYNGKPCSIRHPIIRQPAHFGGYRHFFKCTCTKNGRYCGRLVRNLYFGGHVFACRHCLDLAYLSCRSHRDWCAYRDRADALVKKAELYRKTRHPRKANRLLWLADEYRERGDMDFFVRSAAFLGR